MKRKKWIALILVLALSAFGLSACGKKETDKPPATSPSADGGQIADETNPPSQTLKVAALESAYGVEMWQEAAKAFEASHPGVTVELTTDKNLEDVISPKMKAGDYPDVVHLALGRPAALTDTLVKENALEDITDVLSMKVPGEDITVGEKILPGFTDSLATKPYGDGKLYLAPMFYGPCGLFYNAGLFEEKNWTVPTTWDEMWALGEKAKAEGISLFTYPTTGYFDGFMFALLPAIGGPDYLNKVLNYEEGAWNGTEAQQLFDIMGKLASYTEPTTVANANNDNFLKNQQLILDNKALFMPNGTWIIGEMADAPKAENFKWGFAPIPAVKTGGDRYSFTFIEQIWVPSQAKNKDLAKEFVAFMYSDEAADIFATKAAGGAPAVQPIAGMDSRLNDTYKSLYSVYDNGAKVSMGTWASTKPVEGVSMADSLFGTFNSIVNGSKSTEQWKEAVIAASDALRGAKE